MLKCLCYWSTGFEFLISCLMKKEVKHYDWQLNPVNDCWHHHLELLNTSCILSKTSPQFFQLSQNAALLFFWERAELEDKFNTFSTLVDLFLDQAVIEMCFLCNRAVRDWYELVKGFFNFRPSDASSFPLLTLCYAKLVVKCPLWFFAAAWMSTASIKVILHFFNKAEYEQTMNI